MNWFENRKAEKETKQFVIDELNKEILAAEYELEVTDKNGNKSIETKTNDAEHRAALMEKKRAIKMHYIDPGDVLKVVANVAIVIVMVGFEVSHIMNQKGSRFIKVL